MARYEFSANTGFLWPELPFLDRIRAAAAHGFPCVEFHDEAQRIDRAALKDALAKCGVRVASLNTCKGNAVSGAAIPGAEDQNRRDIDLAVETAEDIGAGAVHVVAGLSCGSEAEAVYLNNLRYALRATDKTILIEPISQEQAPGYFLRTMDQAVGVLARLDHPRLKIMFDCYHVYRESIDVGGIFEAHVNKIGHVQIAAIEGRSEPFPGALNYSELLLAFQAHGYKGSFGCEYRPRDKTEDGLHWRALI